MTEKIDLYEFLDHITKGDRDYLNSLSEADLKSLAPVLVMRWLTGTTDAKQIRYLNHLVNPLVFRLYQHPQLLYKLMMTSSTNTTKRYDWVKKGKPASKTPISLDIVKRSYRCTEREALIYLPLIKKEDIVEMAEALGEDKELIKKLQKE